MKIAIGIIKAILIIILSVVIIGIVFLRVASSTILDEAYVFKIIRKSNYYENLHKELVSNFENYIGPSGLDENVLENVCTVEDLQKDTETILGNIYEGTEKSVDTDEIKKRVTDNINKAVENQGEYITEKDQISINKFAETIADEYISTILHTEYEEKINDTYKLVLRLADIAKKALFVGVIVLLTLLILLNIKTIYSALTNVAVAILASGTFLVASNYIIHYKVKIEQVKILNDSISVALQNIITDILNRFTQIGWKCVIIGVVAIVVGCFFKAWKTEE